MPMAMRLWNISNTEQLCMSINKTRNGKSQGEWMICTNAQWLDGTARWHSWISAYNISNIISITYINVMEC